MSSAYLRVTTDRRTFSVGVSSPPSSVKSPGRIWNLRICSARDTARFASSMAAAISPPSSGAATRAAADPPPPAPPGRAVPTPPPGQRIGIDRDERGDERLPVTDDEDLPDQRVRPQPVFEHRRSHVLAAGRDDDLLGAAGDAEEPVVVELADVAGAEPAVGHRLGG